MPSHKSTKMTLANVDAIDENMEVRGFYTFPRTIQTASLRPRIQVKTDHLHQIEIYLEDINYALFNIKFIN